MCNKNQNENQNQNINSKSKSECVTKIREIFSLLPLINNSVTIRLDYYFNTKHIGNHIIKNN